MTTGLDHEQEVKRLLAIPGLSDDLYHQYLLMVNVSAIWEDLAPNKQISTKSLVLQTVPRCRDAASPDITFHRLLTLSQEDLYDALKFDLAASDEYPLDPGEEIYPDADKASSNWLSQYLWWARQGNCPLAFHVWAGLSVLSTVAQRRVFFPGGTRIWMNMYLMLGGIRSSGKGQAFSMALKMMEEVNSLIEEQPWGRLEKQERKLNILPGDITAESVVTEMKSRIVDYVPKPPKQEEDGTVTVESSSHEQVVDAVGIIPLDEAATFFGKDAWGAARKGVFLTTIKESERYAKSTKKSGPEELDRLAIGMIACCAPAWMNSVMDRGYIGGGLMDRIIWVYREPSWARRKLINVRSALPPDPLLTRGLAQWLIDKILMQPIKMPAQMTDEASALVDSFYLERVEKEEDIHKVLGGDSDSTSANRAMWAAIQVATLLALADGYFPPLIIKGSHMRTAIAWMNIEENSMAAFMKEANKTASELLHRRMVDFIDKNGGCVKKSIFNQEFREYGMSADLLMHVRSLVERELLEVVTVPAPRKTTMYRLAGHTCAGCSA